MLDDIERRALLVQPARKYPPNASIALRDVELDERAGEPLILPRRARFARAQPNHRITHPDRLSRAQRKVANDPVALVEQPEHRDPLGHRRDPRHRLDCARNIDRHCLALIIVARRRFALVAPADQQQQRRDRDLKLAHVQSGFHA